MKGDLNIIDMDKLAVKSPTMAYDLPAGGKRLLQGANGYDATIVSGQVIYRNGQATSALPGKLIRGPQGGLGN
jgi:N-acyl-D-aspartate/D-glutamate deacylase